MQQVRIKERLRGRDGYEKVGSVTTRPGVRRRAKVKERRKGEDK